MGLGPHGDRQFSTASAPRRHVTVRSRCGKSPVRSRLTSAWNFQVNPYLLVRSSARHRRRTQLRSLGPTGGVGIHPQSNAGLVENDAVGTGWKAFRFGFDVSLAAIRSSPNTSLRGGRSPGSCVTRSYGARTAAPPAQQVFGRGGGASTGKFDIVGWCPRHIGGHIVAELSHWPQLRAWGVAADIANRHDRSRDPRPSPDGGGVC